MTKRKFLKELEKKLMVLNEAERMDILNEYRDIIDEKMKHGQTEKEAIEDFGSLETLASEILSAYKINPNYGKEEEKETKVKDVIEQGEGFIKKSAEWLSDVARDVVDRAKNSNHEVTFEFIFEILIKAIILLVICAILRLPFYLIEGLGHGIIDVFIYPVDRILGVIWQILVSSVYFITCVFAGIAMFRQYFTVSNKKEKVVSRKETKETKEEKETTTKEEVKEEVVVEKKTVAKKKENSFVQAIVIAMLILFKMFMIFFVMMPLIFALIGFFTAFGVSIYFLCVGINTIGFILLFLGLGSLFSNLFVMVKNLVFQHGRIYFGPIIVSGILIVVGSFITADTIFHYEYKDTVLESKFNYKEESFPITVEQPTRFVASNHNWNVKFVDDETLKDGEVVYQINYFSDLITVDAWTRKSEGETIISFDSAILSRRPWNRKMYDLVIDDLKNNQIYNYSDYYDFEIMIYSNQNTKKQIRLGN